jgi:hypothetical protein
VGKHVLVHPRTGVGDAQQHVLARRDTGFRRARRVERHHPRLDRQGATLRGHRIAPVDDQVHDDLLELSAVGAGEAGAVVHPELQRHLLADDPPEHARQIAHDARDVDDLVRDHLGAAECEQPVRQTCSVAAGGEDLVDERARGVARREASRDQLGVRREDRGEVVEVVRDAPGEAAERVEHLGLQELLLDGPAFLHLAAEQLVGSAELRRALVDPGFELIAGPAQSSSMRLRAKKSGIWTAPAASGPAAPPSRAKYSRTRCSTASGCAMMNTVRRPSRGR